MALATVIKAVDFTRRRKRRQLEITMSGNYAAGGDTLDLTKATNPSYLQGAGFSNVPVLSDVTVKNSPDGYTAEFVPGTTLANSKIKFMSTADTELAAGAYPANLAAVKLELEISSQMYSGM